MNHVISWSGGKDSTATIILFHEHEKELMNPGDQVYICFAEVMFDAKNNVSGHNPDIIQFMHQKADIFRSWGYNVEFLHASGKRKDFLDFFYHKMGKSRIHPEHEGMIYGFPASGICGVKRDLKLQPLDEFKKRMNEEAHIDYVGIAKDEPGRLESLYKNPNTVSLLDRYGYTEADAKALCEQYDMLSPQYYLKTNGKAQNRDGCWFCPNAKLCEHEAIKKANPKAWKKYVSLEDVPGVCYTKWNCFSKETLHQRDELLEKGFYQMKLDLDSMAPEQAS
jgi:3'-phosphoadenosine 5'-phosphosulfate sulfotransferase (PAPS reductase)/FAD synthetase